ncbi:MAG: nucleotidyl transferase AbiEii/AbiGii toxin family protein [Paludibacteraceae bacterium]|nr:nucleotidyl transferase AbiEii/AbiGii toxin family protein [Paludibacteraceae bacterium]
MDKNKHQYFMTKILLDIFADHELATLLAFKGGTSLLFFYQLTRFSTDLDFNLLDEQSAELVYKKLRSILSQYGKIDDEAMKFYGPIIVLNYGPNERKLKVEVSIRQYDNHYEVLPLLGKDIRVMTMPDMFAHKLCALGERITPRDVYDVLFFLKRGTPINDNIIRLRTGRSVTEYARFCATRVRETTPKALMQGLGEVLLTNQDKQFVRQQMIDETSMALDVFAMHPQVAQQPLTPRMQDIQSHPELQSQLGALDVDLSMVSENQIKKILEGDSVELYNRATQKIEFALKLSQN